MASTPNQKSEDSKTVTTEELQSTADALKSPRANSGSNLNGVGSPSQGKSRFNLGSSSPAQNSNQNQIQGENVGLGAKSMPGSRRTSALPVGGGATAGQAQGGNNGETFGMDKLSLSTPQVGGRGEEDVGAEGARGESARMVVFCVHRVARWRSDPDGIQTLSTSSTWGTRMKVSSLPPVLGRVTR